MKKDIRADLFFSARISHETGESCAMVQRKASPIGWLILLLVGWVPFLSGCGGADDLTMPSYSADQAAQQAMAEYDTNHDGLLDAKELERCPALKNSLASMDKDGDHRLSVDEIAGRIRVYEEAGVAMKHVGCRVFLDGRPLQGATVTYVPEKFMGSSIKQASGVSDNHGEVGLTTAGEKYPGAQPGFYRVQVSKKSANGQEIIPARYNQETTLGTEVYPRKKSRNIKATLTDDEAGVFRLSSKSK